MSRIFGVWYSGSEILGYIELKAIIFGVWYGGSETLEKFN